MASILSNFPCFYLSTPSCKPGHSAATLDFRNLCSWTASFSLVFVYDNLVHFSCLLDLVNTCSDSPSCQIPKPVVCWSCGFCVGCSTSWTRTSLLANEQLFHSERRCAIAPRCQGSNCQTGFPASRWVTTLCLLSGQPAYLASILIFRSVFAPPLV